MSEASVNTAKVGRPKYPLRDLTAVEKGRFGALGYVKFEEYPPSEAPRVGRFWAAAELNSGRAPAAPQ